ncbi:MAG: hypothetical protein ACREEP_10095 [Dongiaceae bacterium]
MLAGLKKIVSAATIAGLVLSAFPAVTSAAETGIQPDGRLIVSQQAGKVIGEYLDKVSGRYGALAITTDGNTAAYYICQSRLWKNCDDYSLEDSYVTIPSGHLAAKLAQSRCRGVTGSDCVVLFVNDTWKRQFSLAE